MNGTTKSQIERDVVTVDVLCDLAAQSIRSFMPRGLGAFYRREDDELQQMLEDVRDRFRKAIRKAQKRGWAAK